MIREAAFVSALAAAAALGAVVTGDELQHRGGVVRFAPGVVNPDGSFDSGGIYLHDNASHRAVGIDRVYVNTAGAFVVESDDPGQAIVDVQVTADETLAWRGITCGPSGGLAKTTFYCTQIRNGVPVRLHLNRQADWNRIAAVNSNVWLGWTSVPS